MADSEHLSALPPGTRLNAYVIIDTLGAGAFGITYRAREDFTERLVAIKEYLPSALAIRDRDGSTVRPLSSGAREDFDWGLTRFRQEARVLVGLKHPNIVPVLGYFEGNGTAYLVMEFQEGRSLGALIAGGTTLEEGELREMLDPLLDGLEAVHRAGFLHRDIKPDNVFIRRDGSPVLIDFGAARQALGQQSQSITAVLTEGYAPFEQYNRDGNQGPWTDIYALGALLYRCLMGTRPVEAPRRIQARVQGDADPLAPGLAALRQRVAPEFAAAIAAALGVTERERPQSVAALRALLAAPAPAPATVERPETRSAAAPETLVALSPRAPQRASQGAPRATATPAAMAPRTTPQSATARRRWPAYAALAALLVAGAAGAGYAVFGDAATTDTAAKSEPEPGTRGEETRPDAEEKPPDRAADERRRTEDAARRKAEDDKRRAEDAARRKAETDRRRAEDAARRKAEDDKRRAEAARESEAKDRADEAARRVPDQPGDAAAQLNLVTTILQRASEDFVEARDGRALIETTIAALQAAAPEASADDAWRQALRKAGTAADRSAVLRREFERVRTAGPSGPVNSTFLARAAINSLLASLDPYSNYLDADAYKELQATNRSSFGGLGIDVRQEADGLKVVTPLDGAPAAKAGLRSGDIITHIDGEPVVAMNLARNVARMRGPAGSRIVLRIQRGDDSPFEVRLVRATVTVVPVRSSANGKIGVIRITGFTETTAAAVREAMAALSASIGEDLAGWIIDLRNNPGGLLDAAIAVADEFLDSGEIVVIRGRSRGNVQRYAAKPGDAGQGKPTIILINGGTASGAEIVAAALKDNSRAHVYGTKSFGKGSVQTIIPLGDGLGALLLTTARYYTPAGTMIENAGITPDEIVEPGSDPATDAQMEAALKALRQQ